MRVRELALGTGPSGLGLKNNKTMQLVEVLNLFGNMDFIVEEWPLKQVRQAWGQKNYTTMQLIEMLNLFGNMDFIGEEWERCLGAIYMLDKAGVMNAHQWFFGRMPHSVMALNL